MVFRLVLILGIIFTLFSCSKEKEVYEPTKKVNPYVLYEEGLEAFDRNDFFFASKKF